jgi:dTDP-4-dehydrorhamnose reductase
LKILITGCGGMLGSAMYPTMRAFGHDVRATDLIADEDWLRQLDVRDEAAVAREIEDFRPDAVYHLAALTDLEYCETHPVDAAATNAEAPATVARLCAANDLLLVYISTAGVFDGAKPVPYDETDTPAPLMVYGQTKLDGERAVRSEHGRSYVVRAGWMFGGERKDHKFVSKIAAQLREGATEIRAVDDKFGTVTYTKDFAANLQALIESDQYGTYHMVCEGPCSRFDVAQEIVNVMGYPDVSVTRVSSDFFDAEYFAPRPRSEMLVNRALKEAGLNRMRPWKEALRDYLLSSDGIGERARVAAFAAAQAGSQPN